MRSAIDLYCYRIGVSARGRPRLPLPPTAFSFSLHPRRCVTPRKLDQLLHAVREAGVAVLRGDGAEVITAAAVVAAAQKAAQKKGVAVLCEQPAAARGVMLVLECGGGADKGADGHRADTVPLCNALIAQVRRRDT
jgi:hypothetical protein